MLDKRHEVLFTQLKDYRKELLGLVEGITEEDAERIPNGFKNNIKWNLGHVYLDQYLWIQHLTKDLIELPEGFKEWFGYGTSPADWKSKPPGLSELKELIAEQPNDIQEKYGDRLEEEFLPTESGIFTIAQLLVRTIYHEGIHLGNIHAIRKFLTRYVAPNPFKCQKGFGAFLHLDFIKLNC